MSCWYQMIFLWIFHRMLQENVFKSSTLLKPISVFSKLFRLNIVEIKKKNIGKEFVIIHVTALNQQRTHRWKKRFNSFCLNRPVIHHHQGTSHLAWLTAISCPIQLWPVVSASKKKVGCLEAWVQLPLLPGTLESHTQKKIWMCVFHPLMRRKEVKFTTEQISTPPYRHCCVVTAPLSGPIGFPTFVRLGTLASSADYMLQRQGTAPLCVVNIRVAQSCWIDLPVAIEG